MPVFHGHSSASPIIMMQGTLHLKWKTFKIHLVSSIGDLMTKTKFTDVTLVSDDKAQFQAHKCVLSACSPVLKALLLKNPHSHPIIYLRGVMQQELESLLQLMYLGYVRIQQDRIKYFVNNANDLELHKMAQEYETTMESEDEPVVNNVEGDEENMSVTTDKPFPLNIPVFNTEVQIDCKLFKSTKPDIPVNNTVCNSI